MAEWIQATAIGDISRFKILHTTMSNIGTHHCKMILERAKTLSITKLKIIWNSNGSYLVTNLDIAKSIHLDEQIIIHPSMTRKPQVLNRMFF